VELRLAQPTISGQLRLLEAALGERLFARAGRGLTVTEFGTTVFQLADEIFGIGRQLQEVVRGRPRERSAKVFIGIADAVPKLIAYRLLRPALQTPGKVTLVCQESKPEALILDLAAGRLDIVLADEPVGSAVKVRAFNHLLGECGVSLFAAPKLAAALRRKFPRSLDRAPFLAPGESTMLGRSLARWFDAQGVRPDVVGEFDDSALAKVFGKAGCGFFAAPAAIEEDVKRQYGVRVIARVDEVRERFYAISVERRLKHPAAVAIAEGARGELFGGP